MSLFDGFGTLRLVKTGPSWRERLEQRVTAAHHGALLTRLQCFRERLERDMEPESWTTLEAPVVLLLADVCDTLGLDERERTAVLGQEGSQVLAGVLGTRVEPPFDPAILNHRQARALAFVGTHGMIDLSTYRGLCPYWSDETLRLDLASLVRRGVLVKNGANKGTYYTTPAE